MGIELVHPDGVVFLKDAISAKTPQYAHDRTALVQQMEGYRLNACSSEHAQRKAELPPQAAAEVILEPVSTRRSRRRP
jgi:hypothetical protein